MNPLEVGGHGGVPEDSLETGDREADRRKQAIVVLKAQPRCGIDSIE